MLEDIEVSWSIKKSMKSTGEMTEPWGTPALTFLVSYVGERPWWPIQTICSTHSHPFQSFTAYFTNSIP